MLNSSIKTSIDVSRQTPKFYAQANMLLRNFGYCGREVKCQLFQSFCTNMYCCHLWLNSTSSSIKTMKSSYNSVLWCLLCIAMSYRASAMFVSCGTSSFYKLLRKCIFDFSERISKNTNFIIEACLSPKVYFFSNQKIVAFSTILTTSLFMPNILLLLLIHLHYFLIFYVVFCTYIF